MATITFNTAVSVDPTTEAGFHIRVEAGPMVMIVDIVNNKVEVRPTGTNVNTGWVFWDDALDAADEAFAKVNRYHPNHNR